MNPLSSSDEQPSASLPIPMGSPPPGLDSPAAPTPPTSLPPVGTSNSLAPTIATTPPPAPATSQSVATDTTQGVVPSTAEDSDLIEKEWVDKAKSIVQANLENPYEQSRELTNLKAEYMKKRYNKDIRLGE